jgi:hypothetical protein
VELKLHYPTTSSWRDAQLKHRDNFIFTFNREEGRKEEINMVLLEMEGVF